MKWIMAIGAVLALPAGAVISIISSVLRSGELLIAIAWLMVVSTLPGASALLKSS